MFDWRRKKTTGRKAAGKKLQKPQSSDQFVIPNHFLCPISLDLMKDPVTLSSGMTYDRESIEKWLEAGNFTCPVTNLVLRSFDQVPNHTLRKMIQEWCVENQHHGVERVPTPRIPVTSMEVSEILFGITDSMIRLDQCGCLDLLNKIKKWGFESERNKLCIMANGTAAVLATAFHAFARDCQRNKNVLEEILAALNWMFPLDNESQTLLTSSQDSLRCMIWFLKNSDKHLSAKQDSILLLQELSCHCNYTEALQMADTEVNEVLFNFIKHPISRTITKASIMIIFSMVISNDHERIKSAFVKMGLVSLLLNVLIDSERAICEVGLGVVDALCDSSHGRDEAYENALTMPVLVKKILRVSDMATEYSVSAIWKLSKFEKKHQDRVLFEALQVGIFQKLVLLLQCGCGDSTKEKATELLKMLNPYRPGLECIESADFKNLQRSF